MTAVLRVEDLSIAVGGGGRAPRIVSGISFSIKAGQVIGLIGESGSGKTSIGLATLGFFRPGLSAVGGRVTLGDVDVLRLDPDGLRALRGNRIAYVAQSAAAAFNPCLTIGEQVIEPILEHGISDSRTARGRITSLYRELKLPDADRIGSRFPHEVSGGQLQRLMAAMAMGTGPELIVFDEPTTALDVTTQVTVLRVFKNLIRDHQTAAIYISHDLAVVAQIVDYIIVLKDGIVVEEGNTSDLLGNPQDNYTRSLIAASEPSNWRGKDPRAHDVATLGNDRPAEVLLSASGLVAGFGKDDADGSPSVKAVADIGFELRRGKVLGVIGESGSGKSTLARVIAGLVPRRAGQLSLEGRPLPASISSRSQDELRRIQIVFQSADTALNPKHTIGTILGRVATQLFGLSAAEARKAAIRALETVQLSSAFEHRFPEQLSGGQKQRVNLARALIARPEVLICDEVTSALDPVIRGQIVLLLQDLKNNLGLSMIFISHDISTVSSLADDVMVMLKGVVVEQGPLLEVLNSPQHQYTRKLIDAVPQLRPGWLEESAVAG